MRDRIDLHNKLEEALGAPYVYFQPPESKKMHMGNRIIYSRDDIPITYANNHPYQKGVKYTVTLVSDDPDWALVQELPFLIPNCRFSRHYVADNLNHDVYTVYV